jgi:hypothetical protein
MIALNKRFSVLLVCLGNSSMHIGGPFIAPRAKRDVSSLFGRPWLSSVRGCTGLSYAHRTVSSARFLSIPATLTVELVVASFNCLAHRTVRWRIEQSGGTLDSPVLPHVHR